MDRTLADVLGTATALARLHVHDRQGRQRGRVFDLRVDWSPGDECSPVAELIYGRTGWMERVGLTEKRPDSAAWSRVREVTGQAVEVAD
jgi:hypothetical protein